MAKSRYFLTQNQISRILKQYEGQYILFQDVTRHDSIVYYRRDNKYIQLTLTAVYMDGGRLMTGDNKSKTVLVTKTDDTGRIVLRHLYIWNAVNQKHVQTVF